MPKILFAHRDATYRASLVPLLKKAGFEVVECGAVNQALKTLGELSDVFLLVDLNLGYALNNKQGFYVAEYARNLGVPCIIVYEHADANDLNRAKAGMYPLALEILPTTGGPELILQAIRSAISHPIRRSNQPPGDP